MGNFSGLLFQPSLSPSLLFAHHGDLQTTFPTLSSAGQYISPFLLGIYKVGRCAATRYELDGVCVYSKGVEHVIWCLVTSVVQGDVCMRICCM